MAQRRILYLSALLGSLVFFLAYQEWLSCILLVGILALPWLSLLLSLPAMLTCRIQIRCPEHVTAGIPAAVHYEAACRLPMPAIRGKLRLSRAFTGDSWKSPFGTQLPTAHCGALHIRFAYVGVSDYLGLICLPRRRKSGKTLLVRPVPVRPDRVPDISRYLSTAYRPKSGGGFAENHELRLYRPGDSLRQIHWKLSAKTGKLILREPMEPLRGLALLTMELRGTPSQLDDKLGQLLWMSRYLAQNELSHQIHCLTGDGMKRFSVANEADAFRAIDALLCCRTAPAAPEPSYISASWRYHIGGDGHA